MAETSRGPELAERAFWSWLGFWVQFLILGLLVVIGAFAASEPRAPGDYACGMLLLLGALVLAFLRLKQWFDGGAAGWLSFLFVDDMKSLVVAIPLFTVIGLVGLFIASAWPDGSLHDAGLGLFVVSGVIIFLDIKRVFDHTNARTR
jgi:uncharacterized membrane protein